MPHAYTEDQLVEHPALELFSALGWQTVSAMEEVFGEEGTLARETPAEAVLISRLRAALRRLNPTQRAEGITHAIDELTRDRSAMSLVAANRELYRFLKEGIPVSVPEREYGGQRTERVHVIDWSNPLANDFLLVSQISLTGTLYTRRPDLVGFVNGLPLVVIEFKKPGVPARAAFDENLTAYKSDIPQLFWHNAFLIASNGTDSRVGSLTADWDRFFEWKRVEREDEPRRVSLETMIRGTCDPARLLDIVENFTFFSEHKAGVVKIIGQNHQVLGVNNAIGAMLEAREAGHGRGGVFWQTQGSGKSFSMVFFSQKVLRRVQGNWTFVVVTDRKELDDQIAKTFKAAGAVGDSEGDESHAQSGTELRDLLRGNRRYVFTLIQKFSAPEMLSDRRDVVVLTDEAHRSQYDTLAVNMRAALPNALFIAFTGTPLIAGEERTREVFGDYVSVYDFQQSVEDGATVPLFYENRTPELHLDNLELNDDIYALIEAAELNEEQEKRLERELGRQYHLITRDDRLDTVARDIVEHFLGRGFQGKAMVVSIDKATALRTHDKVRKYWAVERESVKQEFQRRYQHEHGMDSDETRELRRRLSVLERTDMALIVSQSQNEIPQMNARGLDIASHRKRMVESNPPLDERFKDPDDPLSLVFVCAMWLTGFDAPSCSTVYLDKPMRNHTLMQTIARANRVFPGKHSGLIVDYANVFASLEKALAIYGAGTGGRTPVRDKAKLVEELRQAIADAVTYCAAHGVDIGVIESLPGGSLERLSRIAFAVDALISPDPIRKEFLARATWATRLYDAVKPDPVVLEFFSRVMALSTIAAVIRERTGGGPADITGVMGAINRLLDGSIAADGFLIRENGTGHPATIDISAIDFAALAERFPRSKQQKLELEQLKAAIRTQLGQMIQINKARTDYLVRFEELIESYNAGSRNIEDLFQELLTLSQALSDEQQRNVREHLTEEELTVFDILTRPGPELSPEERDEVKKVARALLEKLKTAIVLDWRRRAQARAQVRLAIEDTLDEGLPAAYTPAIYEQKAAAVFEHIFESYPGSGASVFTRVA
jgi:type I restriction enzyme, R subunit